MNPLDQLKDIHLPNPVSLWPPAIGWWVLAVLALFGLAALLMFLLRHHRKQRYRRLACQQLAQLHQCYQEERNDLDYLLSINKLLKQVSVNYYNKNQVSRLSGEAWLTFLDQTGNTRAFSQGPGRVLATGPYATPEQLSTELTDIEPLSQCCSDWIKGHR